MSDGGDHVGAGVRVGQRLAHQHLHRLVVDDVAAVVHQAVLAVRRVRVERDVGDDAERRVRRLQRTDRPLREAVRVEGTGAVVGLGRVVGDREQHDGRHAERVHGARRLDQQVHRQTLHARHRRDRLPGAFALDDEVGLDQHRGVDAVLGDEGTVEGVAAHAPGAASRERRADAVECVIGHESPSVVGSNG